MGTVSHTQWKTTSSVRFTIGRDHHGWWVVNDRLGRVGGLFTSEDAARHFAAEQADHDVSKICHAPSGTEVELFEDEPMASLGRRLLAHNNRLRHA